MTSLATDATVYRSDSGSYEHRLPPRYSSYKRRCFEQAPIQTGARVLIACCGTGLDFAFVQRRIGSTGRIVGFDRAQPMLDRAAERCVRADWRNVELFQADAEEFGAANYDAPFDVAICTLGLSVIPRAARAYRKLEDAVRPGGTLIVADMKLAQGVWAPLNRWAIRAAQPFGGSRRGHRLAGTIADQMSRELLHFQRREFDLGTYFFCWGVKPQT